MPGPTLKWTAAFHLPVLSPPLHRAIGQKSTSGTKCIHPLCLLTELQLPQYFADVQCILDPHRCCCNTSKDHLVFLSNCFDLKAMVLFLSSQQGRGVPVNGMAKFSGQVKVRLCDCMKQILKV